MPFSLQNNFFIVCHRSRSIFAISIDVSLHTVPYAPHIQVLARCPKLNNLKGSCLVSVLGILQHWWNQERRFGENPELPWLDVMLLIEYNKYQTNTICISRIPGQLALGQITMNSWDH